MTARHYPIGQPVHANERAALQFLVHALPDSWNVYSNIDVPSGRGSGGTYEHDAIVVAPHAVFTIEIKGFFGRTRGNRDRWSLSGGATVTSPLPLLLAKARALKGWLAGADASLSGIRVEGLVFLSADDAVADLGGDFASLVVTRQDLARVLLDTSWVQGAHMSGHRRAAVEKRLGDGQPPKVAPIPGFKDLQQLDAEHRPYEMWLATSELTNARRLLHVHPIEGRGQADQQRRLRAAQREALVYEKLKGVEGVLAYFGHVSDSAGATQRYALEFEDTTPLLPLLTWLAEFKPGLPDRLDVAQKVATALAEAHARKVVHRRLHPGAILVQNAAQPDRVVLTDFETAKDTTGHAPTVSTRAMTQPANLCAAPELLRAGVANERSDLFSLGAVLVHLLTDRPLFQVVDDVLRPFELPSISLDGFAYPAVIAQIAHGLLAAAPEDRPVSARGVADRLSSAVRKGEQQPQFVEPGLRVDDRYELLSELGTGATAQTWKAIDTRLGTPCVLKILDGDHHQAAEREREVLAQVRHANLVVLKDTTMVFGSTTLVLDFVDGLAAELQIGAGDPLKVEEFSRIAIGLIGATHALHEGGWLHRDIKPQNILLRTTGERHAPVLLDVGLAAPIGTETDLAVGTMRYKDPLVYQAGRWTVANDLFALALVLYELATGTHPYGSDVPAFTLTPQLDAGLLPSDWPTDLGARLMLWLGGALDSDPARRPATATTWLADLQRALAVTPQPALPLHQAVQLTQHARPEDWLKDLAHLRPRALGAAARLGARTLGDLVGLDVREVDRLHSVGVVALKELRELAKQAEARWPDFQPTVRDTEPLCRDLAGDPQPLDVLDAIVSDAIRDRLLDVGVQTVGSLALLAPLSLHDLTDLETEHIERLRVRLRRIAGVEAMPASSLELRQAVAADLSSQWQALADAFGLDGNDPPDAAELESTHGVSGPQLEDAVGIAVLRSPMSAGPVLLRLLDEALPAIGLASEEQTALALQARLPGATDAEALGWVRLAQVLRSPTGGHEFGRGIGLASADIWQPQHLTTIRATLATEARWPPVPRSHVVQAVEAALPATLRPFLASRNVDAAAVVDCLLRLDNRPCQTTTGLMYTPPVALADALAWLRTSGRAAERTTTDELRKLVAEEFVAVVETAWPEAVAAAGFVADGATWIDPQRVRRTEPSEPLRIDPGIQRERLVTGRLPQSVQHLVAAMQSGGLRVVCTRPVDHAHLSLQLVDMLREVAGAGNVNSVDVNALLLHALQDAPKLWALVPAFEAAKQPSWKWATPTLEAALEAAIQGAVPGRITVLHTTALLATLDLLGWLQRVYDRARGGRLGLIVVVVPGAVYQNRVRFNDAEPFPYTPDMAAVLLEVA